MKILLATDGSAYSDEAAKFLTCFDFTPKDSVHMFHVVSEVPYEDDYRLQVMKVIRRFAPQILKTCEQYVGATRASLFREEGQGIPEEEIVKKASELDADLIVMGARGVKGLQSLFLGSVTRTVAAMTDRAILATKPCIEGAGRPMKVLFATDGSGSAEATGAVLGNLPFPKGSALTILNIAWSAEADIPDRYAMEIDDALKAELAQIRTAESERAGSIVDRAKERYSEGFAEVHGLVKGGDPAQEILRHAEEMQADLIAMGSRGLKGIKGMLGSVSRRVLDRAECSVLIGRANPKERS